MSDKKKILIQFDSDHHASVFDRVVAVDAGVDEIFSYAGVTHEQVTGLVHGAMFTRGPADLKHTAVFIGGSSVPHGEGLLKRVTQAFFGPLSVSVMLDSNGSNTTAAAAVLCARKHLDLGKTSAVVLGTGPVGGRAARLLAREGATVNFFSRTLAKASIAADETNAIVGGSRVVARSYETHKLVDVLGQCELAITAGAAGVQLIDAATLAAAKSLRVAIDVNAVPPLGIAGVDVMDKAKDRSGVTCYGAIGVGGTKMKIHKEAIRQLFSANNKVLDAEQIYDLGKAMA